MNELNAYLCACRCYSCKPHYRVMQCVLKWSALSELIHCCLVIVCNRSVFVSTFITLATMSTETQKTSTLAIDTETYKKLQPREYYKQFLQKGVRSDGRALLKQRKVSITTSQLINQYIDGRCCWH